ncbi:MAG: hypothetical protein ACRECN_04470, partial [Methylocella sp.]
MARFSSIRRSVESLSKLPAAGKRAITRRMLDSATTQARRIIGRRLGPCATQDAAADIIGEVVGSSAAGGFKRDLARYAMGGRETGFLASVLRGSGLSKALAAIFGRGRRHEQVPAQDIARAQRLLEELGYEVRRPQTPVARP